MVLRGGLDCHRRDTETLRKTEEGRARNWQRALRVENPKSCKSWNPAGLKPGVPLGRAYACPTKPVAQIPERLQADSSVFLCELCHLRALKSRGRRCLHYLTGGLLACVFLCASVPLW
jgi:hypothetical protein